MNETVISWSAPNIVTGIAMVSLTLVLIGFAAHLFAKKKETSNA